MGNYKIKVNIEIVESDGKITAIGGTTVVDLGGGKAGLGDGSAQSGSDSAMF